MTPASDPCCHHLETFPTTAALFQIKYTILTMTADALTVTLAQSEVQMVKMQVILQFEHGHGNFLINKDKWTQKLWPSC